MRQYLVEVEGLPLNLVDREVCRMVERVFQEGVTALAAAHGIPAPQLKVYAARLIVKDGEPT